MTPEQRQRALTHYSLEAATALRIEQLEEALRKSRHDLWLFAENSLDDTEVIRAEVAIRVIDEALGEAGASHV